MNTVKLIPPCPVCGIIAEEVPLFHLLTYFRCNNCKDDIEVLKNQPKKGYNSGLYKCGSMARYIGNSEFFNLYFTQFSLYDVVYSDIDVFGVEVNKIQFSIKKNDKNFEDLGMLPF